MWKLHNLASAYGKRPAGILGIRDSWTAYQLDLACLTLGRWVENRLAERNKKGRPVHRLEKLLAQGEGSGGRFRSLKGIRRRRK